jgi:uncharacterized membrane protein SirB2
MPSYLLLKHFHLTCAALSIGLFVARGARMAAGRPAPSSVWLRALPHLIDTLLFGSALALLVMLDLNPLEQPWLLAKLGAVIAYILLAATVLKRGRQPGLRRTAYALCLVLLAYIVAVAFGKQPWPF